MAAALLYPPLPLSAQSRLKTLEIPLRKVPLLNPRLFGFDRTILLSSSLILSKRNGALERVRSVSGGHLSEIPVESRNYEFSDGNAEVELRLDIGKLDIMNSRDIFVDMDETSLLVRVKASGTLITLIEANPLFDKIKPSETIWYIDEDQLVVNLKKHEIDLRWPDLVESWESLRTGIQQLLKGTSIYIVGDSTDINERVANELATGIGYVPLHTSDLLESYAQQSIDSWIVSEGADSVAEAEGVVLQSLSSHVRSVVATLGGQHGAARRHDKWQYLYSGFTVWLSISEAAGEAAAKEEARRHIQDGSMAYTNAEIVLKLGGWDPNQAQVVAQACLSALKQLTLSDKQLTGMFISILSFVSKMFKLQSIWDLLQKQISILCKPLCLSTV
ncbi:putative inactive shikimate kinase like 2, chloroplastic [Canna indica]|uniref:Inactive shikimate kinase like 2, chloroplastic n=1 Tax=Canna indica TaxID=4628 RepID=A0AAQ3K3S3_9LILI|nr:putative inactive shikimate kinase like 2, chloroplastic [Canna indica]